MIVGQQYFLDLVGAPHRHEKRGSYQGLYSLYKDRSIRTVIVRVFMCAVLCCVRFVCVQVARHRKYKGYNEDFDQLDSQGALSI